MFQTPSSRANATPRMHVLRVAFTALFTLPLSLCTLLAQASNKPCAAADLDIAFHFGSYPPSTNIINVIATNTSTRTCTLTPGSRPRFLAADRRTPAPISIRLDGNHLNPVARPPIMLNPNQSAHQTIRWTISPANSGPVCTQVAVLSVTVNGDRTHPSEIVAPTLLPPICSEVAVESYALGPVLDEDGGADPSSLRLSSARTLYSPGESFSLEAQTIESGDARPGATSCQPIFLRERTPEGDTRLQELDQAQPNCLNQHSVSANTAPTEIEAAPPIKETSSGVVTLQLFALTSRPGDTHIALIESSPITLHVAAEGADEVAAHNR